MTLFSVAQPAAFKIPRAQRLRTPFCPLGFSGSCPAAITLVEYIPYYSKEKRIMKILAESTLTSKEQLTVPKVVRQLLDVHAGDSLIWSLDEQGQLVVSGGRPNSLADIRAAVAAAGSTHIPKGVTVEGMKSGIAVAMRRKHGRS